MVLTYVIHELNSIIWILQSNIVLLQEALLTSSQSNIVFFICFLSSSTLFPVQLQTFWKCENWYQARSVFKRSGLHWATLICMDLFLVSNVYVCVSLSRNTELISSAIKAKGSRQAPIATSSPTSLFCRRNWNWEVENRSERRKISSIWVLTDRYLCTRACVDVLLLQ